MIEADVIVLSSAFFYFINAQLKAVIDRTVARWLEVKIKEFSFIVTCADEDKKAVETMLACFRGYLACFEGAVEKGAICETGVYQKGDIKDNKALIEAYQAGLNV